MTAIPETQINKKQVSTHHNVISYDFTCLESPNGSWHMGHGDAESWRCTDILFTFAHSAPLRRVGGASTRPIRCARLKGGGALSNTCSTSFLDVTLPPPLPLPAADATDCSTRCSALGRTVSLPSQLEFRESTSVLIAITVCLPVCCCLPFLRRGPCFPQPLQPDLEVCNVEGGGSLV